MKDAKKNEIYSDFYPSIIKNSKTSPSHDKLPRNRRRSKSQDCYKKSIERLIAFISDKNKFYINPTFDQEGSKVFLQSKYLAMEKIILDDDLKNQDQKDNNCNRNLIKRSKHKSCLNFKREKNDNTFKETYLNSIKNTCSNKKKTVKTKDKIISSKAIVLRLTLNDSNISDELKVKKKHRKNKNNCKEFELKMLKDKNIKSLEPIDGDNNMDNHQNIKKNKKIYNPKYPFIGNDMSNSSIENIISEMQSKNDY